MRIHEITDKVKKLTKQEACVISDFFITLAVIILFAIPASAKDLHFITVIHIADGKEQQYNDFIQQIVPVWQRHGVSVLIRTHILSPLMSTEESPVPDEIAVFSVKSQENFRAYLADPDYRRLKKMRMDALEQMVVLEAWPAKPENIFDTEGTPLYVFLFHRETGTRMQTSSTQEFTVIGQELIKGQLDPPIHLVEQVTVVGLSFDDNPLSFLDGLPEQSAAFVTQTIGN